MSKRKKHTTWEFKDHVGSYQPTAKMYRPEYEPKPGKTSITGGVPGITYGAHCMKFSFMGITFWFSYETLIAFNFPGSAYTYCRKNDWNITTGKHIRAVYEDSWYPVEEVCEEDFLVIYANSMKQAGHMVTGPFAVECEPGSWDRTGNIVLKQPGEVSIPDPTALPPPIRTKREAARRRALDSVEARKKKEAQKKRIKTLKLKAKLRKEEQKELERLEKLRAMPDFQLGDVEVEMI
jgi:hypothetical protein